MDAAISLLDIVINYVRLFTLCCILFIGIEEIFKRIYKYFQPFSFGDRKMEIIFKYASEIYELSKRNRELDNLLNIMFKKFDIINELLLKERRKNEVLEKKNRILLDWITNKGEDSKITSKELIDILSKIKPSKEDKQIIDKDEDRCIICLKRKSEFISMVCEHKLYCNKCMIYRLDSIVRITDCPICRKKVEEIDTID